MRISDWSSDVCSSDLRDTIGPAMVTIGAVAIVIDTLVAARLASGFRMLAALLWSRLGAAMALLLLALAVSAAGSIDPARYFIIWIRVAVYVALAGILWERLSTDARLLDYTLRLLTVSAVVVIGRASCRARVCEYV